MGKDSKIAWTDHTFNPWWGCTKVSPGCEHCYAETMDKRTGGDHWGLGKARRRTSPANWREPVKWNKAAAAERAACGVAWTGARPRVFCASMADWLDPEVPAEWLADLLELVLICENLDFLMLSKRVHLWRARMEAVERYWATRRTGIFSEACRAVENLKLVRDWLGGTPPPNVWVGCTVEDQRRADERIPALLDIPARVRFLSCEPLLEEVRLDDIGDGAGGVLKPLCGLHWVPGRDGSGRPTLVLRGGKGPCIDWVIVGGESGSRARPFAVEWAEDIVARCLENDVPVFVKQLGAKCVTGNANMRDWPDETDERDWGEGEWAECAASARYVLKDRAGADPAEWPADLRVQQWPESK